MKNSVAKRVIWFFFGTFICVPCFSQSFPESLLQRYKNWTRYEEIHTFYQLNRFQLAWCNNKILQKNFTDLVKAAPEYGLNGNDYKVEIPDFFRIPGNNIDSFDFDIHFTDAAIHFFSELSVGNKKPAFGYEGLNYKPSAKDVVPLLYAGIQTGNMSMVFENAQPESDLYKICIRQLSTFISRYSESGFKDMRVTSTKADVSNKNLLVRLYQLGISNTQDGPGNKDLIEKIKKAQKIFNLPVDGILRTPLLQALNIPVKRRIAELTVAINDIRWLNQISQKSFVLILNIPSATLMVYDKGNIVLESKVIVGKKSTHTPTLTSVIDQVILYPYWVVPDKIARNELLPAIKRNIHYLDTYNYQVLNSQGRVVNPYSLNWHSYSGSYFPYKIRQSTGCDNSLGIVKFNFYNPFTVYLHDTPNKPLFSYASRFFSHGCMRVEKYIELAHLLLGENRIAIDTLIAKGCINQQHPIEVPAERKLGVIVLYSTAWYNKENDLKFYLDIYNKNGL